MMFHKNRVQKHTTSYLRWIVRLAAVYPRFLPCAERAAVELLRRGSLTV